MNTAIEILEVSLKQAQEQSNILLSRIDRNEFRDKNKINLAHNEKDIAQIQEALIILRRSYL